MEKEKENPKKSHDGCGALRRLRPDAETRATSGYAVLIAPILLQRLERMAEELRCIEATAPERTVIDMAEPAEAEEASHQLVKLHGALAEISDLCAHISAGMRAVIVNDDPACRPPQPPQSAESLDDWHDPADAVDLDPDLCFGPGGHPLIDF